MEIFLLSIKYSPDFKGNNPSNIFIRVDFPAPLQPEITVILFFFISKFIFSKTLLFSKAKLALFNLIVSLKSLFFKKILF